VRAQRFTVRSLIRTHSTRRDSFLDACGLQTGPRAQATLRPTPRRRRGENCRITPSADVIVRLAESFAALSDATRRDIVTRVLHDEASVSTLARHYDMSFAAVQKHVAVLERAQLVTKQRRGREQIVSGEVITIRAPARLLGQYEQIWRGRIGRIEEILTQPAEGDAP
jgi:DNA-binding transcriptional ArsR family regulator